MSRCDCDPNEVMFPTIRERVWVCGMRLMPVQADEAT